MQEMFWRDSKWLLPGAILLVCTRQMLGAGFPQFCKRGQPVALLKVIKSIPGILAHQSGRGRASATVKFLDAAGWALAPQLVAQRRVVRRANATLRRATARSAAPVGAITLRPDEVSEAHGGDIGADYRLAAQLADPRTAADCDETANASGREFVVVQIGASFAFAGHVLKCLQDASLLAGNANGPFADRLFAGDHFASDSKVRCPEWQLCPATRKWMHAKLEMMDTAQKEAWKHALSSTVALVQGPPGMRLPPPQ